MLHLFNYDALVLFGLMFMWFENGLGERSCYDEGKRTAETLAMDYHRGADVEVIDFEILFWYIGYMIRYLQVGMVLLYFSVLI